jgi:hypothetical protein
LEYPGDTFQLLNPSIRKKGLIVPTINVSCNPVDNMSKSCYYADVILWIPTFVCKGQSNEPKGLEKDIKMIPFTDNSVIEKLQFCWNSGNVNLNFNLDIVAVLRQAPMTSL